MARRAPTAAIALAAAVAGVHLALGLALRAPIIHPDEAAQLTGARYLAGRGRAPGADSFPGYDLLLAPLARLAGGPLALWRGALVANAVLAGVTALLLWALARRLAPAAPEPLRLLAVAAVAAYPALALTSNLAVADNLVAPLVVAVVLLAWRAAEVPEPRRWLAVGAAAGAVAATQRTGAAVALAAVATAVAALRPARRHRRQLAAAAGGALAVAAAGWVAALAISRRGPGGAHEALSRLAAHLEPGRLADLPVEVAGQLWYLAVATWGLYVLGLAAAAGSAAAVARRGLAAGPAAVARALAGAASVAMVLVGSMFLRADGTIDAMVAGRANETVLAPVLLVGLVELTRLARGWRAAAPALARRWALAAGAVGLAGALLVVGRGAAEVELPVLRTNVLGLDGLLAWRGMALSVVVFSAVAVVAAALVLAVAGRSAPAAFVVAGALFVPSVASAQRFMVEGSRQRAGERAVAEGVLAVRQRLGALPGGCVAYDQAAPSLWHRANYELFLPGVALADYSSRAGPAPCALAVSGRADFAASAPGSRRVMLENDQDQALWASPGPAMAELARAGWLLPDRLPAPLPAADQRYRIELAHPGDGPRAYAMRRGAQEAVDVTITHAGTSQPWPSANGQQTQFRSVRVGVRWYRLGAPGRPDGHATVDDTRVELPRTLLPGERATVRVPLVARAKDGSPLRPGTYQARVAVVQNGVEWFRPVGPPLVLDVVVVGRIF